MKKIAVVAALLAMLSGCIVVPPGHGHGGYHHGGYGGYGRHR